jgi:hypothetical protein
MPRITLAYWYGDKAPGDTIDVDEVAAKAMRRDGLVAAEETVQEQQAPAPAVTEPAPPQPQPPAEQAGDERAVPSGRRKR